MQEHYIQRERERERERERDGKREWTIAHHWHSPGNEWKQAE
jgi:hypothetical protein